MIASVILAVLTCVGLVAVVLLKPQVKIAGHNFNIYAFVPLLGAIAVVISGALGMNAVFERFLSSSPSNPVKILILFISMSLMSVILDESGFFEYIAQKIAERAGKSQLTVFVAFYLTVSILTVFTSNDVVILTFTPFICQFCKKSDIDPVPYVVTEFVGANTWSLLFLIGNPTNVFISQAYGVTFFEYFLRMWLPTLFCGVSSFVTLLLIFGKKLKKPLYRSVSAVKLKDKTTAIISLCYLAVCTVTIAISSYLKLEMWLLAFVMASLLYLTVIITNACAHKGEAIILHSIKRAPWQMIPLVLGMFVIVLSLVNTGATAKISSFIGESFPIIKYGVLSTLFSNLLNNIPMSVLFSSIAGEIANPAAMEMAMYSTVIGSNVGAFLTPLGALAGLMFTSIVRRYYSDFGFKKFVKYGAVVAVVSLVFGLIGLRLSYFLF